MPRIPTISVNEASKKVKEVYADIARVMGGPSPPFQRFANDPEVLNAEWHLEKALMFTESGVPARLRKYISLTASILYGCGD